ncbi:MAG TPA: bifunctional riboflavin kinase/FAD synthetase [Acidimicrobiales bacterium]|nr:bifunctional riboflavin kinase/FAD synthetase [Acidimicrobiales bacterium]
MEILRADGPCPAPEVGAAVTIGAYDGVHLGHRAVIAEVRRRAEELGVRSAVVTFDRHPAMVVRPESAPRLLTDLDQKLELLASTGVDVALVVRFDQERAAESAEDFVREVIVGCLAARTVVVGEDFHFGHGRRGTVDLLRRAGAEAGFTVEGLGLRSASDVGAEAAAIWADATAAAGGDAPEEKVSSTAIRAALVAGAIDRAIALLGRPHEVRGLVSPGDRRGRELGFPTANVAVPGDILLPADGIYAGWLVRADGTVLPTAINLGRRPTFYEQAHASLLEAHVLDFDGDLYGERVAVRFVARLHGEVTYPSVEALIAGIAADCDEVRGILGT